MGIFHRKYTAKTANTPQIFCFLFYKTANYGNRSFIFRQAFC